MNAKDLTFGVDYAESRIMLNQDYVNQEKPLFSVLQQIGSSNLFYIIYMLSSNARSGSSGLYRKFVA